jgi:thiamine pyrophosphate protein domain protein TPP-binding protein
MHRAPVGIFRQVERPAYDDLLRAQVAEARAESPHDALQAAMSGKSFWEID